MKLLTYIASTMFIFIFAGCVQSLHSLYTEKDLVFDPMLIGTWTNTAGDESWTFEKSDNKTYLLTIIENQSPEKFDAHLVQLGKYKFLDIFPKESDTKNYFYNLHLIPVHTFSRVELIQDSLGLSLLDMKWLKGMIENKKIKIKYEKLEENIILTASTTDLQKMVLKFSENTDAFPNPKELFHKKN